MDVRTNSGVSDPLYACYSIEVHVSDRTFGHMMSDVVVCTLDVILMIIAVFANFLAILAYKRTVLLQTPSNYLLMTLSIADILLALTAQPLFLLWKILEHADNFSCAVHLATVFTINFFGAVSFLITCLLISLERYYSVFYPSVHRNSANKDFFKVTVFLTVFIWLAFLTGTFFGNFHRVYFMVAFTVVILCLLGTVIVYTRIFLEMSRRCSHHQISNESIPDERQHLGQHFTREKATLVNMTFIIGAMMILYAPVGGCAIYAAMIGRDWVYMNYFVPWAYLLVFASSAINPFLYGWKNRSIRRSIRAIVRSVFEETDV